MMNNNKSIILLSGGLDSLVSLGLCKDKYNVVLALTFDYGQKSAAQEIEASAKICRHYGVEHKVIKLNWLAEILLPEEIWVPNRNGLFLNIAASFADAENFAYIVFGANKEEARNFSDNSQEFIDRINAEFEFSTQNKPKVIAPLVDFDKNEIVKTAVENSIPLEFVRSCYSHVSAKHCGICTSCINLRNALEYNRDERYIRELF